MRNLPPSLRLLLKEVTPATSVVGLRARLRSGLLRELQDQSMWALDHWGYADSHTPSRGLALIAPGDALNPLVGSFKCSEPLCRNQSTIAFGRYVALYTDGAILPDYLTNALSKGEERGTLAAIRANLPQLVHLLPLVRAGLLRFARPIHEAETPQGEAHRLLREIVRDLIESNRESFVLEYSPYARRAEVHISSPRVTSGAEPITHALPLSKREITSLGRIARLRNRLILLPPAAFDVFADRVADIVYGQLHGLLIQMHTASASGSTLMVGAAAETFVLQRHGTAAESRLPARVENLQTVRLPWVNDLTIAEAVHLREEAGTALERLRARVAVASNADDGRQLTRLVADLNEEAAEIGAELKTLRTGGPRLIDSGFTAMGIGLILYGLTNSSLVAAAAGFSSVVAKLREEVKVKHQAIARQLARPGYALLKARQLLGGRELHHRRSPRNS